MGNTRQGTLRSAIDISIQDSLIKIFPPAKHHDEIQIANLEEPVHLSRMASPDSVELSFELTSDNFPHGWFFNRFRKERIGDCTMLTLVLLTDAGVVASNAVVLSGVDIQTSANRLTSFLENTGDAQSAQSSRVSFTPPPTRVYPVNHIQLSRVDQLGEIGFYRFSIATAATQINESKSANNKKIKPIQCYPVVMFRCDLSTQIELVKELLT